MPIHSNKLTSHGTLPKSFRKIIPAVMILWVWFLFVGTPAGLAFTDSRQNLKDDPNKPWHIAADELTYDHGAEEYIAKGNVTITKENKKLSADFVRFNHKSMDAHASGHVLMTAGEDVMTGNELDINLATETGTLYDGTIFLKQNHFYINGNKLQKTGDQTYSAEQVSLTSCDGPKPAWKITGRNMNVTLEGYGTVQHAAVYAKSVPILYSPYLMFPAKIKRQSGLLTPEMAYSNRNGFEYTQPFYWAISDSADATFYLDHITERGEMFGAEYRYVLNDESKGTMLFNFMDDRQVDDGTGTNTQDWGYSQDADLRPNSDRYWFRMKHDHALPNRFYAKLDLDIVSDQDYLQDFRDGYMGFEESDVNFYKYFGRDLDDYNDPVRINRLNVSKYWAGYSLNTEARWYDDVRYRRWHDDDPTLQKLPYAQFYGSKKPVMSTPLYFDLNSEYTNYYRKDGTRGQRADLYPRMYYPYRFKNYFTFEPSVGVRQTAWYTDTFEENPEDSNSAMTRNIYDVELDLSTEFFKVFSINGQQVDRLKHVIRPRLVYTYVPDYNQDKYPYFDRIDRIDEENILTYSLTNTFTSKLKPQTASKDADTDEQTVKPFGYAYREFLRFLLEQSYDFNLADEDDPEPFTPIYGEVQFEPFRYLMLQADAEYSHYDGNFESRNIGSVISDLRGDQIFTEYRYAQDMSESIYTNLLVKLSESFKAYMDYERNIYDSQRIQSGFGLKYYSQCWSLDLRYMDEVDDTRYVFLVNLFGLGGFGSGAPSREFEDIFGGRDTMLGSPYQVISTQ
jgi:LPS-assembly protein